MVDEDAIYPHKENCFGYECGPGARHGNTAASLEIITSILFGIENGDKITPVNMFEFFGVMGHVYELIYPMFPDSPVQDGGHHRLLAHKLGKHMMDTNIYSVNDALTDGIGIEIPEYLRTDAEDMIIKSRPYLFGFAVREKPYKVPKGLENPKRYPTDEEVKEFLKSRKNQSIKSAEILKELYGVK